MDIQIQDAVLVDSISKLQDHIIEMLKRQRKSLSRQHPFNTDSDGILEPDEIYRNFKYRLIALEETTAKILDKLGMEND